MKELFRNPVIRKYFISVVLNIPVEMIRSTRLLNTYLWRRYRYQKQGILDVLVELNDDTKINIELQVNYRGALCVCLCTNRCQHSCDTCTDILSK